MKNKRALLTLFTALFAIVMATSPVYAYTYYHGATASWEYGDTYATSGCYASYDLSTGEVSATAVNGGYAMALLNSANVDAVADVDNIVATIWYTSHIDYVSGYGSYVELQVGLLVNGVAQGDVVAIRGSLSSNGYEQFVFDNVDVNYGDSLDISLMLLAAGAPGGSAYALVDFSYVGFTTD